MSEDCVFCKIVKGEIPSEKILENENFIAIKTIEPKVDGHFLIIPKKHYSDFLKMPSEDYSKFLEFLKECLGTFSGDFNVILNNGKNAGQIIEHMHFHILPRKFEDGFKLNC